MLNNNFCFRREAKESEDVAIALSKISPTIELRHHSMERDRRCILAYVYNRLMRLKELRWEIGSILPNAVRMNFSESEVSVFLNLGKGRDLFRFVL